MQMHTKLELLSVIALFFTTTLLPAQHLNVDGRTGIGTAYSNTIRLTVEDPSTNLAEFRTTAPIGPIVYFNALGSGGQNWALISTADGAGVGGGKFVVRNITNGIRALVANSNGHIGLGTSSPTGPLEIAQPFTSDVGGFAGGVLQLRHPSTNINAGPFITGHNSANTNTQLWYVGSDNNGTQSVAFLNRQTAPLQLGTANTPRLIITGGGQVGIGTATPEEALDVNGDIKAGGDILLSNLNAEVGLTTESGGIFNMDYNFRHDNVDIDQVGAAFRIDSRINDPLFNWIRRTPGETNEVFLMAMRSSGDLGIGTTNPACKLDVVGTVCSNGTVLTSDRRFKQNIRPLEGALQKIAQLKGVSYRFRTQEFPDRNFREGDQLGLIAQDLEEIFPELVYTWDNGFKAVNYDGLIPVLIEAVKEQQIHITERDDRIRDLERTNRDLETRLQKLEVAVADLLAGQQSDPVGTASLTDAKLEQNHPNPFTEQTSIRYFIPDTVQNAELRISDISGRILKIIPIETRGEGQTLLEARALSSGTYAYSLVLDEQLLTTKKMVLTR